MNYLFDISHPGHAHLFRHTIGQLKAEGHKVVVTARQHAVIERLLTHFGFRYHIIGGKRGSVAGKVAEVLRQDWAMLRLVLREKINVGVCSGIVVPHVSPFTSIHTLLLDDDDDAVEPFIVRLGHPFTGAVLSPAAINRATPKNIAYPGTHELAYLHPARFTPDFEVCRQAGLLPGEPYFILRFVAFKGHHDGGESGIAPHQKRELIAKLSPYGRVFITSESPVEPELEPFRIPVAPEHIHSFMAHAALFIGDSQTMTSEAAVLGVPALKCNTFAGRLSVPNLLEERYGLCQAWHPRDFNLMTDRAIQLIQNPNLKQEWQIKRQRLLNEMVDVAGFLTWFVRDYPHTRHQITSDPGFWNRFRD
jgi:predicted glycosyltransferase